MVTKWLQRNQATCFHTELQIRGCELRCGEADNVAQAHTDLTRRSVSTVSWPVTLGKLQTLENSTAVLLSW